MKILAVHSALAEDTNRQSQVDHWRIYRPLRELAKHVDWEIDHEPTYIPDFEKYKDLRDFTDEELSKALLRIAKYDIVFSSYHADPAAYTLLKVAHEKHGTQFVMDMDDDIFHVNEDNPFWLKMDDRKAWMLQVMVRENRWITTTNEYLANVFRQRRMPPLSLTDNHPEDTVVVLPNAIPDDYKAEAPNNGNKIVIGYFGGSSHYGDVHDTGMAEAVEKIMHENKNVYFKAVGMPLDKYVPRARYEFTEGKRGTKFLTEIFPKMQFDVSLGPLEDNEFNLSKSDIKWQESTRMGAAFVASNVGPYSRLPKSTICLVENNTKSWYNGLKKVIDDISYRKMILRNARKELETMRLEVTWNRYREVFERVKREDYRANGR